MGSNGNLNDSMTICHRCGSDACYEQQNNNVTLNYCFQCGFQYNSLMTLDSQFLKEQMEILPEIYKLLMSEDEDGRVTYPSFTNVEGKGMVYANGISRNDWWWEAIKYKKLKIPEVKNHQKITEKINPKSIKKFKEQEFLDALEYIKVL